MKNIIYMPYFIDNSNNISGIEFIIHNKDDQTLNDLLTYMKDKLKFNLVSPKKYNKEYFSYMFREEGRFFVYTLTFNNVFDYPVFQFHFNNGHNNFNKFKSKAIQFADDRNLAEE